MSLSPFIFFSLTPDEDSYTSPEEEPCTWIDDSECQENLFQIISLAPEETVIDKDNHIIHTTYQFFFKELGYFTEEPEPIDPDRDYEQEAKELFNRRNKKARQNHVNVSRIPSLEYGSRSGISSSSSSIHHEHHLPDCRSPHFLGSLQPHHHSITNHKESHQNINLDPKYYYPYQYRPNRLH